MLVDLHALSRRIDELLFDELLHRAQRVTLRVIGCVMICHPDDLALSDLMSRCVRITFRRALPDAPCDFQRLRRMPLAQLRRRARYLHVDEPDVDAMDRDSLAARVAGKPVWGRP